MPHPTGYGLRRALRTGEEHGGQANTPAGIGLRVDRRRPNSETRRTRDDPQAEHDPGTLERSLAIARDLAGSYPPTAVRMRRQR